MRQGSELPDSKAGGCYGITRFMQAHARERPAGRAGFGSEAAYRQGYESGRCREFAGP